MRFYSETTRPERYFLGFGKKLDLEKISSSDLYAILDEIPSDVDSEIDDEGEDENESRPEFNDNPNQNIDIENIPIIFEDDLTTVDNDEEWGSEDEQPLSEIRRREISKTTIWTSCTSNCLRDQKQFDEESGPNIPDTAESPLEVFLQIFPKDLIEHLVFQTNLYAFQKTGNSGFVHTNPKEMSTFLGLNLLMGIKKLPSYLDFWSSRRELRDEFISSSMSRDRFKWLLGNIHVNDNSVVPQRGSPQYDKLYKLRPFIQKLSQTFLDCYKPSKNQAVDESMIRFKGRSTLKQYMPLKPIKRGYKVWIRADSSGYVCQFQIYTGRIADASEKDLGGRVVRDLTRVLIGKGHHVYFDNYFNSVDLQKDLQLDYIYSCGTVKQGRKNLPRDIINDKDLRRGESEYRVSLDGLVYMKWKDRKAVNFLANHMDPSENSFTNRKQKDGTLEEIPCPKLVMNYNKHMGFVDKFDMLKSLYEIDRKSKKWWHRIFWYFLDAAVVNAFILFQERAMSKSMPLKIFKLSVALGLIGSESSCPKRGRQSMPTHFKSTVAPEIR